MKRVLGESPVFLETSKQHPKGTCVPLSRPFGGPNAHSEKGLFLNETYMREEGRGEELRLFLCVNFEDSEVDIFMWIALSPVSQCEEVMAYFIQWRKLQSCLTIFV